MKTSMRKQRLCITVRIPGHLNRPVKQVVLHQQRQVVSLPEQSLVEVCQSRVSLKSPRSSSSIVDRPSHLHFARNGFSKEQCVLQLKTVKWHKLKLPLPEQPLAGVA